jgi:hypothetical protein
MSKYRRPQIHTDAAKGLSLRFIDGYSKTEPERKLKAGDNIREVVY